jgi:hypothetical protein
VLFSDYVIKINKKGKEQTRVMLITNRAIYNLMPKKYSKCKRRILISDVSAVTSSDNSDEFVLHIPDEYDYRFKSSIKDDICLVLKEAFKGLAVTKTKQSDLKGVAITKAMARLQTREQVMRRKQEIAEAGVDAGDDSDSGGNGDGGGGGGGGGGSGGQTTQLMENTEKVTVDDFELLKVLGRGSFGKVMQCVVRGLLSCGSRYCNVHSS